MYDSKIARFLQEDDSSYSDSNDPLSLNLYTYCLNNPLIYDDPTGHTTQEEAMHLCQQLDEYRLNNANSNVSVEQKLLEIQQIYANNNTDFTCTGSYKDLTNIQTLKAAYNESNGSSQVQEEYDRAINIAWNNEDERESFLVEVHKKTNIFSQDLKISEDVAKAINGSYRNLVNYYLILASNYNSVMSNPETNLFSTPYKNSLNDTLGALNSMANNGSINKNSLRYKVALANAFFGSYGAGDVASDSYRFTVDHTDITLGFSLMKESNFGRVGSSDSFCSEESQSTQIQRSINEENTDGSQNIVEVNKKIPNPNGKKGGPAHQGKIKEIEDLCESEGLTVEPEAYVKTPGGKKSARYGDLLVTDNATGEQVIIQVGKQTKAGNPVAREISAMSDLEAQGYNVIFVPYN